MVGKSRMEYVIKTCSADNAQELQKSFERNVYERLGFI